MYLGTAHMNLVRVKVDLARVKMDLVTTTVDLGGAKMHLGDRHYQFGKRKSARRLSKIPAKLRQQFLCAGIVFLQLQQRFQFLNGFRGFARTLVSLRAMKQGGLSFFE